MSEIIEQLKYVIDQNDPDCCKAIFYLDECKKILATIEAAGKIVPILGWATSEDILQVWRELREALAALEQDV